MLGTSKVRPLKILLVEDNQLNQKFAMAVLKRLGHNVELAVNGKIGVDMFCQNSYDLILMDIQMPEMNGLDATKEIRKIEMERNETKPIIIIAVTAFAMEHDKRNCIDAGMDDYMTKPFKPVELEDHINAFFINE